MASEKSHLNFVAHGGQNGISGSWNVPEPLV